MMAASSGKTLKGLQCHLAGQLRCLAQIHEAAGFLAGLQVFGKIATCLAHDPQGCALSGLAHQGAQEDVVFQFSHGVRGLVIRW